MTFNIGRRRFSMGEMRSRKGAPAIEESAQGTAGDAAGQNESEFVRSSERRTSSFGRGRSRVAPVLSSAESGAPEQALSSEETTPVAEQRGPSLKMRALGYLSRRDYSRSELRRKLVSHADSPDEIEPLLDTLVTEGWLSDARFAESLAHRRSGRFGARRILGELKQHAVAVELVERVADDLRETEWARARSVWEKKFGELPQTASERARQARFLAMRGFSGAVIGRLLKGGGDDGEYDNDGDD
jgi:regulatory protein